jgi:hypothetical protein
VLRRFLHGQQSLPSEDLLIPFPGTDPFSVSMPHDGAHTGR